MSSDGVDGVREVGREEAALLEARGLVADLAREQVIVHVGKPVGSITGWVGPVFWQVWTDVRDPSGTIHARVEQAEAEIWQLDPESPKDVLLDQAKDRMISEVQSRRARNLDRARADLSALETVRG